MRGKPTAKQVNYIKGLNKELKLNYAIPGDRQTACLVIDELLKVAGKQKKRYKPSSHLYRRIPVVH